MILEHLLIYVSTVHLHTSRTVLTARHHDSMSMCHQELRISFVCVCPQHTGKCLELNRGRDSLIVCWMNEWMNEWTNKQMMSMIFLKSCLWRTVEIIINVYLENEWMNKQMMTNMFLKLCPIKWLKWLWMFSWQEQIWGILWLFEMQLLKILSSEWD